MYSYIKGVVTKITPSFIVLENMGIGYEIIVPNPFSFSLDIDTIIYLYQYIREDQNTLYGFQTEDEKQLFLKLISVNGIGPKSALSILASASVSEIISAIETRNDTYLKKFPGIGAKASQQIILDLKGKINFDLELKELTLNSKSDEIVDALVSLGYAKKDSQKAIDKLDLTKDLSTLIKEALKILNK